MPENEKFTVIDYVKSPSDSVVCISGNHLEFNLQSAVELQYPMFVQVLINSKDKQFAIRACRPWEQHAILFSKPEGAQTGAVMVFADVACAIRKMADWDYGEAWCVPGAYIAEDNAIMYDVKKAVKLVPEGTTMAKQSG